MIEVLPVRILTDEDAPVFGSLNVALGKLQRTGLPVGPGVVITAPNLKLKTVLESFDFGSEEVFEQSLNLVKKEINATPVPEDLYKELGKHKKFLLNGEVLESVKNVWFTLLGIWIDQIKERLWKDGFYPGITQGLDPQIVIFLKKIENWGSAYFDPMQDDTVINITRGSLHPNDLKKLDEIVREANKKLFIPHEYEWIIDGGVKLTKVLQYTPASVIPSVSEESQDFKPRDSSPSVQNDKKTKSTVKVFLDLSTGLVIEREVDGIYIASEKIFDLNKPKDSFEDMVFKLIESAAAFPGSPILFKLADKSEGMGRIRGALRLLHQKSLFEPMLDALDFTRHKRGINNIHIVVPFVRNQSEFLQIKRELAVKKLGRKASLKHWLEVAVPENIINIEDYLVAGLDGVVLNLDELISYLNGFDKQEGELTFYKNDVESLIKFLEDGIRLLHKSKVPFIALGSSSLNLKVLDFLIEKGVYGIVIERFEAPSAHDLLHQAEKRMILRKAQ